MPQEPSLTPFQTEVREEMLSFRRECLKEGTVGYGYDSLVKHMLGKAARMVSAPKGTNAAYYAAEAIREVIAATPSLKTFVLAEEPAVQSAQRERAEAAQHYSRIRLAHLSSLAAKMTPLPVLRWERVSEVSFRGLFTEDGGEVVKFTVSPLDHRKATGATYVCGGAEHSLSPNLAQQWLNAATQGPCGVEVRANAGKPEVGRRHR